MAALSRVSAPCLGVVLHCPHWVCARWGMGWEWRVGGPVIHSVVDECLFPLQQWDKRSSTGATKACGPNAFLLYWCLVFHLRRRKFSSIKSFFFSFLFSVLISASRSVSVWLLDMKEWNKCVNEANSWCPALEVVLNKIFTCFIKAVASVERETEMEKIKIKKKSFYFVFHCHSLKHVHNFQFCSRRLHHHYNCHHRHH